MFARTWQKAVVPGRGFLLKLISTAMAALLGSHDLLYPVSSTLTQEPILLSDRLNGI